MSDVISLGTKKALDKGNNASWTLAECLAYALEEVRTNPEMKDYKGGMVLFFKENENGFSHRTLTSHLKVSQTLALLSTELHQTIEGG